MNVSKSGGYWTLYYRDHDGVRRGKRIGKVGVMSASKAKREGERVFRAICAGTAKPNRGGQSLASWLDDYYAMKKHELGDHTYRVQQATRAKLVEFFGPNTRVADITPASADDFRVWLHNQPRPLSENTVRNHLRTARAIFARAKMREVVRRNPFDGISSSVVVSKAASFPWTDELVVKVLEACPSWDWRGLVALCYYGGLRRSEAIRLRWEDVLWDQNRLVVVNRKTARATGRSTRNTMMLLPLERILLHLREVSGDRERVLDLRGVDIYRGMKKITHDAGLGEIPSAIKSMRAARATAWKSSGEYPEFVVDSWLGHSMEVSRKHYVSVPESMYVRDPSAR